MKIRNGFVSNSSSSSFIVVGTDHEMETFLVKAGYDPDDASCGKAEYDGISVISIDHSPYLYGMDIHWRLESGERVPDLKKEFLMIFKERFGIDVPEDKVNLEYGDADS